jgi:uncharacterized membrane-anchored protein YitT (DUF2179 family)
MTVLKKLWPTIRDFGLITAGTLVQAVALRLFLVPADLASGGVSGISQLVNHYTGWPIGLMVLTGNIPLFVLGWRYLGGRRFAMRTGYAIVSYSFLVDAVLWFRFFPRDGLTQDLLLNSLYGAVVSGIGYALVYRGQGTSGGSDILARIMNRWKGIPMTHSYLMTDTSVVLAAGLVFGWTKALYAIITLYVSGLVVDAAMEGGGTIRTAIIISAKPQLVAERIIREMERGVTILSGRGGYSGDERPVLYCVLTRSEIQQLKSLVAEVDSQAFMVIGTAYEALGEGFSPLSARRL